MTLNPEAFKLEPMTDATALCVTVHREESGDVIFCHGHISDRREFARLKADGFLDIPDRAFAAEGFRFMADHMLRDSDTRPKAGDAKQGSTRE